MKKIGIFIYITVILFTGCEDHTKEYSSQAANMIVATCNVAYNKSKGKPLRYMGYMNSDKVRECSKYFLKNYAPLDVFDEEGKGKKMGEELRNFF